MNDLSQLKAKCPIPLHRDGDGHVDGRRHEHWVQRVEEVGEEVDVDDGGQAKGPPEGLDEREQEVEAVQEGEGDQQVGEERAEFVSERE